MLFNLLPAYLRKMFDVDDPLSMFKHELDTILSDVPDEPTISGLSRKAKSNSLIHQMVSYIV